VIEVVFRSALSPLLYLSGVRGLATKLEVFFFFFAVKWTDALPLPRVFYKDGHLPLSCVPPAVRKFFGTWFSR